MVDDLCMLEVVIMICARGRRCGDGIGTSVGMVRR